MTTGTMGGDLPVLYRPWIEALLGGRVVPAESEATCDRCAMLPPAPADSAEGARVYFDPRVKCCTYVPALPNFIVGRILLDRDPQSATGRASVEARIAAGAGVTPAGLAQPPTFVLLYRSAPDAFGRSVSMRCPHYLPDTGSCGIWIHRHSVCATWFCKHVRGAIGHRFWTALRRLLEAVERSLVAHCVLALDPGENALQRFAAAAHAGADPRLSGADVDGVADPAVHSAAWGRYAGREREFYQASARIVERMAWDDVVRAAGAEVKLHAALVRRTYEALTSQTLRGRLRVGAVDTEAAGAGCLQVTAYSAWDPLVVPAGLVNALRLFDGRSTRDALAAVAAETGLEVEPGVVRRLVDFGVLVAASGTAPVSSADAAVRVAGRRRAGTGVRP